MSYNGIGLQTARGSGTNGYVQSNLSSLFLAKKKIEYNAEDDIRRMEAEVNKAPNQDLLNHERKRQVEIKVAEFEMLMEEKGFDDDEIEKKTSDYRKLLLSQLESGELNLDDELDIRNSHAKMDFGKKSRDKWRDAFGLKKDYVPGSSMENMKKTDVVGAALEAEPVTLCPMAFFDERELIDLIRHELRIEDDLGFTARIIPPPNRRGKYGGLPLNFRQLPSESEDEDPFVEQQFQILESEPKGSKWEIEKRMRSRTVCSNKSYQLSSVADKTDDISTLFIRKLPEPIQPQTNVSELSKQIDKNLRKFQNPLNEYSRFEAVPESRSCQKFIVKYPEIGEDGSLGLEVFVLPNAMVFELVGLCCLRYFLLTSTELPGKVEEYSLFIVDDDTMEIDREFPPLEKNRVVGDLGFPSLALVRANNNEVFPENEKKITVIVFFTSGEEFLIDIPKASTSIGWLCDEALRRWRESKQNEVELIPDAVYIVESLACEGKTFSKESKNSSRVGFNPRKPQFTSQISIVSPTSPTSNRNSAFDFPVHDVVESPSEVISCFKVTRLHRFKWPWTANLVIRYSSFEIVPFSSESERRKSFFPQQYQKITKVPWELMCNVEYLEKEKSKSTKEQAYYLTFTFLLVDKGLISPDFPMEVAHDIPENSEKSIWKSIQVECKSREDAIDIYNQVNSLINARESPVHEKWMLSNNGLLTPTESSRKYSAIYEDAEPSESSRANRRLLSNQRVASIVKFLRMKQK
ncbi:unnamed protein product [Auanema sp. JU1783]|nr:unnamed protein product [Auanema sp. JU1783]